MTGIISSFPARIIEVALDHPVGFVAVVLGTIASVMHSIKIYRDWNRSGS